MTGDFDGVPGLERLERRLRGLLIAGVAISAALLLLGLVLLVAAPAGPWPGRLLAAGLIILMATPILRVVVSMVEYARMREWFFVIATVVVLAELAAGVVVALQR